MRRPIVLALLLAAVASPAAAAPPTVDPATLEPPPPADARCTQTGADVICHTVIDFSVDAEFVTDFGLPCGGVYLTAVDVREGLRFYSDGLLVRRHVKAPLSGFLSLSASGDDPRVAIVGHLNWWNDFAVPGDESSEIETSHGLDIMFKAPGGGVLATIAGRGSPDGSFTGIVRFTDDPATAAAVCEALGA